DIIKLIKDNVVLINDLYQFAKDYSSRVKYFYHILVPICEYINNRIAGLNFTETVHNEMNLDSQTTIVLGNIAKKVNGLMDAVLLTVQDLRKLSTEPTKSVLNLSSNNFNDEENIPDGYIRQKHEHILN